MHLVALALTYLVMGVFTLLAVAITMGHIRMALWKRKNRRLVDRLTSRPSSTTTLAEHYTGRRPIW